MRVLIIEDEHLAAQRLVNLLKQVVADVCIADTLQSVKMAVEWFRDNTPPDLLFLDIQLEDGDAFTLLNKVNTRCPIVFTTAHKEFALTAFNYNSIGYLLKPYRVDDLEKTIVKYSNLYSVS